MGAAAAIPPWPFAETMPLGVTAVMLPELGFEEQVALCAELGVTHYVYRPRVVPEQRHADPYSNWGRHKFDLTPKRLLDEGPRLQRQLETAGLSAFGTVPALTADATDDEIELCFRGAVAAGASRVRMSPRPLADPGRFDFKRTCTELVSRYRHALEIAGAVGLPKVVIEIHTGLPTPSAGLALHVLQQFDPARLGAILDLPNLAKEGFTAPGVSVSALGDYLDHLHVGGCRRTPGEPDPAGFRPMVPAFCSLRDSDLYVPDWLRLVRQFDRVVPLVIEDFTPDMTGASRLRRTVQELHALAPLLE